MSLLWRNQDAAWASLPLNAGNAGTNVLEDAGIRLLPFGRGAERGVVLLVRLGVWVRVNGRAVPGGLHVLEHKDEILLDHGRQRFFFSAEERPVVVPFVITPPGRAPSCPVCRGVIKDGDLAVCCPGCGRWYHQGEKPCFTYAPTCKFCKHPTALDGGPVWHPEQEESHAA